MKKLILICLFLLSFAYAQTIQEEIQNHPHYKQEFEKFKKILEKMGDVNDVNELEKSASNLADKFPIISHCFGNIEKEACELLIQRLNNKEMDNEIKSNIISFIKFIIYNAIEKSLFEQDLFKNEKKSKIYLSAMDSLSDKLCTFDSSYCIVSGMILFNYSNMTNFLDTTDSERKIITASLHLFAISFFEKGGLAGSVFAQVLLQGFNTDDAKEQRKKIVNKLCKDGIKEACKKENADGFYF